MHPNPHMHRDLARDIQGRRIAAARDASIDASRRRQLAHPRETPAQSLVVRFLAAAVRLGS